MDELDPTIQHALDTLNDIPGVRADRSMFHDDGVWVRVFDEDSVGEFFKATRELDANRDGISREGVDETTIDGWLKLDE